MKMFAIDWCESGSRQAFCAAAAAAVAYRRKWNRLNIEHLYLKANRKSSIAHCKYVAEGNGGHERRYRFLVDVND